MVADISYRKLPFEALDIRILGYNRGIIVELCDEVRKEIKQNAGVGENKAQSYALQAARVRVAVRHGEISCIFTPTCKRLSG